VHTAGIAGCYEADAWISSPVQPSKANASEAQAFVFDGFMFFQCL
jgi:hypothetical protein